MHITFVSLTVFATLGACASNFPWKAPLSTDRRSPCPMVNSLANHGYLPRNGLNVSLDDLVVALNTSVNLAPAATRLVGAKALLASTTGNSATFNLDDLNTHGVIEHDGSLSRNDVFFGDNHSFNKTIWDSVAAHFTSKTISIANAAAARAARLSAAQEVNPEFNMTATDVQFSLIESALYLAIFGNVTEGNAVTKWVDVMFRQERLPCEEGWKAPTEQVTAAGILALAAKVGAAV